MAGAHLKLRRLNQALATLHDGDNDDGVAMLADASSDLVPLVATTHGAVLTKDEISGLSRRTAGTLSTSENVRSVSSHLVTHARNKTLPATLGADLVFFAGFGITQLYSVAVSMPSLGAIGVAAISDKAFTAHTHRWESVSLILGITVVFVSVMWANIQNWATPTSITAKDTFRVSNFLRVRRLVGNAPGNIQVQMADGVGVCGLFTYCWLLCPPPRPCRPVDAVVVPVPSERHCCGMSASLGAWPTWARVC